MESESSLHIAMCPWFAFGHIIPYIHISNKLAQKGHKISFFIPRNTQSKVSHFNRYPNLITLVPISVPHVDGLPLDRPAETTSDVSKHLFALIMTAMDRSESEYHLLLRSLGPNLVFYDLACWIPSLARKLGIKSVHYSVISPATIGYTLRPNWKLGEGKLTMAENMQPPQGFPDTASIYLHVHEARGFADMCNTTFGSGIILYDRAYISITGCDALAFKACREIDGPFVDYVGTRFRKTVLLAGLVTPEDPPQSTLDEKWARWLNSFKFGSVVFCGMGSEGILERTQFQELVLGLELSGLPFLAVLKPPPGTASVEEALPDGFLERVGERGVVHGGWIQQELILGHPSIGCFVTHCGSGSLTEAMGNPCQIVMIPHEGDHFIQARVISNRLKARVEVERREEDGWFSREGVSMAIRTVMDEVDGNELGREIRMNRSKLHKLLQDKDMAAAYIDDFSHKIMTLVWG